jgi:hypothetical protein
MILSSWQWRKRGSSHRSSKDKRRKERVARAVRRTRGLAGGEKV